MAVDSEQDESAGARLEHRWTEQLTELRVAQTGTQIMMGFLLTLVFQPAFHEADQVERVLYLSLVITAFVAAILAIAPVSLHRILFGHPGAKERIVAITQVFLQLTLALLALVFAGTVALIFRIVIGGEASAIAGVIAVVFIATLWLIVPMWVRRNLRGE